MFHINDKKQKVYSYPKYTIENVAPYITGDRDLICYDTETTGIKIGSYPVQIAAVKMRRPEGGGAFQVVDVLNILIKPPIPVPPETSAVHGLTDEILADCPTEDQAFPRIKEFFGDVSDPETAPVIFGYNSANFDTKKIMNPYYIRMGELNGFNPVYEFDTYKMAKEVLNASLMPIDPKDGKRHMRLIDVAGSYGISSDHFHNALGDIEVTVGTTWALYNDFASEMNAATGHETIKVSKSWDFNPGRYKYKFFDVYCDTPSGIQEGQFMYSYRDKSLVEKQGNIMAIGDMETFSKELAV